MRDMFNRFIKRLFGGVKRPLPHMVGDAGKATHSNIKIDNEGHRHEVLFGQTAYGKGHAPANGHKTETVIELSFEPLLNNVGLVIADIVARYPDPTPLQYPDDDNFDYESPEGKEIRSAFDHSCIVAERAQANAARIAANSQTCIGAAQVATALNEWANALEASAARTEHLYATSY